MRRWILVWVVAVVSGGCVNVQVNEVSAFTPEVTHIVVCWLKNPANAADRAQLINESRNLGHIPGVVSVSAGTVLPSDRAAVDSSFDVAIVMKFKDEAALVSYSKNPMHLAAVERTLKPLVAKYVVYDFREE